MSNMCETCIHYEVCVYEDEAIVECTNYQADANNWIPCSERLPAYNQELGDVVQVLVKDADGDRGATYFMGNMFVENHPIYPDTVPVVAWMPMPK